MITWCLRPQRAKSLGFGVIPLWVNIQLWYWPAVYLRWVTESLWARFIICARKSVGTASRGLQMWGANGEDTWGGAPRVGTHWEPQSWYEDYLSWRDLRIPDVERSLLRAFLIWLKAATSDKWGCHEVPLWSRSDPRRETKYTINPLSGVLHKEEGKSTRTCLFKHFHQLSYLQFVLLKTHLSFLKKPFCSSHRSPFSPHPKPFPY